MGTAPICTRMLSPADHLQRSGRSLPNAINSDNAFGLADACERRSRSAMTSAYHDGRLPRFSHRDDQQPTFRDGGSPGDLTHWAICEVCLRTVKRSFISAGLQAQRVGAESAGFDSGKLAALRLRPICRGLKRWSIMKRWWWCLLQPPLHPSV